MKKLLRAGNESICMSEQRLIFVGARGQTVDKLITCQ